jgi:hypothetical protein
VIAQIAVSVVLLSAAAFFGDASPVARKLIEDRSRQYNRQTVLPDKFLQTPRSACR